MASSEEHDVRTVAASVAALREAHPCTGGRGYDFDGFFVFVESNSPALLAELDAYFQDFRGLAAATLAEAEAEAGGPVTRISAIQTDPPDFGAKRTMTIGEFKPSVKGPKEAFFDVADGRVVHKLRTGMWFLFGREDHLAIGPCTDNPNQVINFINNRMIQWSLHRGALLGHASAVGYHSAPDGSGSGSGDGPAELPRCIAIAGRSGMGKSTLSLHLMNDRRLDFLSNDRVMIRPPAPASEGVLELEGVPKHPRINPGTILNNPDLIGILDDDERAKFGALPSDELWQLEHKYDGLIRTCFPDQRFVLRGRLVGLVLLNWTRGAGPTQARRIRLREHAKLLEALMKQPGVFYLGGHPDAVRHDLGTYLERLDGLDVLELAGGIDFDAGREAALDLLGLPPTA